MSEEELASLPDRAGEPLGSAAQMSEALEAGGIGLWEWRFPADLVALDAEARRLLNLPNSAATLLAEQFYETVHPGDLETFQRSIQGAIDSDGDISEEFRLNGSNPRLTQWICLSGRVLDRDEAGRPIRAAGVIQDITDRRFDKEASDLLNRELTHRMKNLFSVVGSIAAVSAESHPEAMAFVQTFQSRLNSLAAAHDLLRERQWLFMPLEHLAARIIEPLGVLPRIDIEANDLMFGDYDVQTLVLVLHELATNALKHGALSNETGRVMLTFEALDDSDGEPNHILMAWRETAGPPVSEPNNRGFGMTLLERLAKRHGHDAPVVEWREDGLSCRLRFRAGAQ
ncbi:MAG: sensor histidine kinase [Methyloligella sp. ZOD6]